MRGGRLIELKKTVDAAVSSCPQVRNVLVAMRTENPVEFTHKDVDMEEVRDQRGLETRTPPPPEILNAKFKGGLVFFSKS